MRPPDPDETSPRDNSYRRSACTECQRRKQKCNREWPCNHCQKRKVAEKCRFLHAHAVSERSPPDTTLSRKRPLGRQDPPESVDADEDEDEDDDDDDDDDFEALGYGSSHLFANLNPYSERKAKPAPKQFFKHAATSPQLERALQVLPPKQQIDKLVHNFVTHVNFHYYIIYPPTFLEEYTSWWTSRTEKQALSIHWTCLFLMACACSIQHTTAELQRQFEHDIGESAEKLTERYHKAARELHSIIPVGNGHLLSVQKMLYSCYWFKTEARFIESWHVLSSAIREAQELGIHQEGIAGPMPEFDREMRRRVWCIMNAWDWQISALLCRPMIIDRSDCDVGHPSLRLEGYSPSPLSHMKLQSELIGKLSQRFGHPKNITQPKDVQDHQQMIETWMQSFPPHYNLKDPDNSMDEEKPWIKVHRYYLQVISFSMLLDPMRTYLAKQMPRETPAVELKIRSDGIDYALKLLDGLYALFECIWPRDTKFHYILFSIFDTAAVMCSAIMHDADQSIPRKNDMRDAVQSALGMLERLKSATKLGRTSYKILLRLTQKLTRPLLEDDTRKRPYINQANAPQATPTPPFDSLSGPHGLPDDLIVPDGHFATSASPSNTLSADGSVFYNTPPYAAVGNDPVSIFGTTPTPLATNLDATLGMPEFSCAPDGSLIPSVAPHGLMTDDMLPSNYTDMQAYALGDYADLSWADLPEDDLAPLASLWKYQNLDLNYVPPPMPHDPNQRYQ